MSEKRSEILDQIVKKLLEQSKIAVHFVMVVTVCHEVANGCLHIYAKGPKILTIHLKIHFL